MRVSPRSAPQGVKLDAFAWGSSGPGYDSGRYSSRQHFLHGTGPSAVDSGTHAPVRGSTGSSGKACSRGTNARSGKRDAGAESGIHEAGIPRRRSGADSFHSETHGGSSATQEESYRTQLCRRFGSKQSLCRGGLSRVRSDTIRSSEIWFDSARCSGKGLRHRSRCKRRSSKSSADLPTVDRNCAPGGSPGTHDSTGRRGGRRPGSAPARHRQSNAECDRNEPEEDRRTPAHREPAGHGQSNPPVHGAIEDRGRDRRLRTRPHPGVESSTALRGTGKSAEVEWQKVLCRGLRDYAGGNPPSMV
jgi:hypothetical protein